MTNLPIYTEGAQEKILLEAKMCFSDKILLLRISPVPNMEAVCRGFKCNLSVAGSRWTT